MDLQRLVPPAHRLRTAARPVAVFGGFEQLRGVDLAGLLAADAKVWALFDRCDEVMRRLGAPRLLRAYEEIATPTSVVGHRAEAYPSLAALQIALFERALEEGAQIQALYSLCTGHAAAAYVAGAVDLDGAMRLALAFARFGRICVRPAGAVGRGDGLWVTRGAARIPEEVFEATRTAPALFVTDDHALVVGYDVPGLMRRLDALGVTYRPPLEAGAPTTHTPFIAPAEADFRAWCEGVEAVAPTRPWFSAATGGWVRKAPDASFWWRTLSGTVRCNRDAVLLAEEGLDSAIEMGRPSAVGGLAFGSRMTARAMLDEPDMAPSRLVGRVRRLARKVKRRLSGGWPRAAPATRAADALEAPEGWAAWDEHVRAIRGAGGVVRASNGALYVAGYRDLRMILRDEATFSSSPLLPLDPVLLGTDGEAHQHVRRPLAAAFAAPALSGYGGRIPEAAALTLRAMAERDETDLVAGFAGPLTLRLTWDLLGFEAYPPEQLARWSRLIDYEAQGANPDPEAAVSFQDVAAALYARVADGAADGVLAALAHAPPAMASPEAFESALRALLIAGTVTTRDLIGNAVLMLLRYPEAEAEVRADRSRLGAFLEEVLRLETPVQRVLRRTTGRAEVGGQTVEAGTLVVGLLGAANRDPAVFDAPDAFRMGRPRRALSFGYGPHSCIGRYWAMQEATGALGAVLDAWPVLESALPLDAVAITPFTARGPVRLLLAHRPVVPDTLVSAAP